MGINYMAGIAKLLGVELDKEFNIKGVNFNPHKITDKGLVSRGGYPDEQNLLMRLLTGEVEITNEPWFPEDDEPYWFLSYEGHALPDRFKNDFTSVHQMRVRLGNFFKTEQEALSYKEKWLAYYNQGADMSWRASEGEEKTNE